MGDFHSAIIGMLLAAAAAGPSAAVTTTVLDFNRDVACAPEFSRCINGRDISNSYGDTAEIDMSYARRPSLDGGEPANALRWTMFPDESAYPDDDFGWIEIALQLPGRELFDLRFDLHNNNSIADNILFSVTDRSYAPLAGGGSLLDPSETWAIDFTGSPLVRSADGLIVQFWAVGGGMSFDNLGFSVREAPVETPAPAALTLMGLGAAALIAARRRTG